MGQGMGNWKTFNLLILSCIAILAFYICASHLTAHSFNNDEIAVLWHQTFPLSRLLNFSHEWAFHPPLYLITLKGWVLIFGSNEFNARYLSVVCFVAICLLPYFYRKTFSFPWWIFSLLLISSYPMLELSRLVIPYSFASLMGMASWFQLLRWKIETTKRNSILMIFFITLCFYTHYLAWAFVMLIFFLSFLELVFYREYARLR
jgi:hypothetical protein